MQLARLIITIVALPTFAAAEVELTLYTGMQSAAPSDVSIRDEAAGNAEFDLDWQGQSLDAPLYYGLRATQWRSPRFGVGVDFTRNKVSPTSSSLPDDYEVLEFSEGLNTLTVNAYRRWSDVLGGFSPYVGGGLGVALPYVDVTNSAAETDGYQLTGPAATWIAGASVPLTEQWSVFGEYKGTFSANTADLDSGGTLEADVLTNAVNLGVSFNF